MKAIYRSWGIPCSGKQVYAPRHRVEWLGKIRNRSAPRAEFYYQQLDALRSVRQEVRRELLAEGPETPRLEMTPPDSFDRSDPGSRTAGYSTDPAPFPHQAAALDLQRFWHRDEQQR